MNPASPAGALFVAGGLHPPALAADGNPLLPDHFVKNHNSGPLAAGLKRPTFSRRGRRVMPPNFWDAPSVEMLFDRRRDVC